MLRLNPGALGEHLTSQLACLTISHMCLLCLPNRKDSPFVSGAIEVGGNAWGAADVRRRWIASVWNWQPQTGDREVVEPRSNYKKSYLWWFRNIACGDPTGRNGIEKDRVRVDPGLDWGKGEKGWYDLVCVENL